MRALAAVTLLALTVGCGSISGPWGQVGVVTDLDNVNVSAGFPWRKGLCKWDWSRKTLGFFQIECEDGTPPPEVAESGE